MLSFSVQPRPRGRRTARAAIAALAGAAVLAAIAVVPSVASAATATNPAGCQPYLDSSCMLPFPDNRLTVTDKQSSTGLRLKLPQSTMPVNGSGVQVSTQAFDLNDGFSPGSSILLHIPQLDTAGAFAKTDPVGLLKMAAYKAADAPIMVINEATGKRQMIYAQLDANATSAAQTDLMILPGSTWKDGQTYAVVLRNLKQESGKAISAPAWFRPFLKGKTLTKAALPKSERAQYSRYVKIFAALKRAGVKRDASLYATWNFTVASTKSLTGQLLGIRDAAFKTLGESTSALSSGKVVGSAPGFQVTSTATQPGVGSTTVDVVTGTFQVPCYLQQCGDAATAGFTWSGKQSLYSVPSRTSGSAGTATADFECIIPSTASASNPARISLYGHGLLGWMSEVATSPQIDLATTYNIVMCATPWWGLEQDDEGLATTAASNLNDFPTLVDRLQEGVLNMVLLGRLLDNPAGLASAPQFEQNGQSLINTSELYYDGNSQGGIMGGVTTAVSPDIRHAVLGVTGEDYGNMLIQRSTDFGTPTDSGSFAWLVAGNYAKAYSSTYPLVLDLMDQEWDRADPDGYVEGIGSHPLANTPSHAVLMDIAYGDHQVSMYAGAAEARALGADAYEPTDTSASALTQTALSTDPAGSARSVNDNLFYGLTAAPAKGYTGSVIEVWDSGPGYTLNPPLANIPPTNTSDNNDPHEDPRSTPLAQAQISDWMEPDGTFVNVCDGPCHSYDYTP